MFMRTTEILEQLDSAKQTILDVFNDRFYTELGEYEDIEKFLYDEASEYISTEERLEFEEDYSEEYEVVDNIQILIDEVESYGGDDFEDTNFILEDDFEEYCKELVDDCYDMRNIPDFIKDNIDWGGVADDLRVDYSEISYEGETYLFR